MSELSDRIARHSVVVGAGIAPIVRRVLPVDYIEVLKAANGFVTEKGWFRLFGTNPLGVRLPSIDEWNASPWKKEYGGAFDGFYIIAEDVFGDQYGFLLEDGANARLCKAFCEGAKIERLEYPDLKDFLLRQVLVNRPTAFDFALADAAEKAGIRAGPSEHLAFQLPLICGGEYQVSNLTVESPSLHLGLLGQMTKRNASLEEGTKISRILVGVVDSGGTWGQVCWSSESLQPMRDSGECPVMGTD